MVPILVPVACNSLFLESSVEKMGVEPTTSCMPCKRSSQLSYIPVAGANIKQKK